MSDVTSTCTATFSIQPVLSARHPIRQIDPASKKQAADSVFTAPPPLKTHPFITVLSVFQEFFSCFSYTLEGFITPWS